MNSKDNNTISLINWFENVKENTNNFSIFRSKLLEETSQNLVIFRTILGLTTNSFSRKLGIAYSWIKTLERVNKKIKSETAQKLMQKIVSLFKEFGFFNNVNYEEFLRNYNSLNGVQEDTDLSIFIDKIVLGDFESFNKIIQILKDRTNNFSYFPSSLILEDSRILVVVRILLGLSQHEFAKSIKMGNMTVEELENGYRKIKWPVTAREYSKRIQSLLKNIKLEEFEPNWKRWLNTRKIKESKNTSWKTIRKMNLDDFQKYFLEIKADTTEFNNFNPTVFQERPQIISIFRILVGLTQMELNRELNFKGRVIANYEDSRYKTLSLGRAQQISDYFRENFKENNLSNISLDEAVEKFIHVKNSMYDHSKAAFCGLQQLPLTKQEDSILKLLKTCKSVTVEPHANIDTGKGTINVDFKITINDKIIAIIEATNFFHVKSVKFSTNSKSRFYLTDYRFTKIKHAFKDVKTIFITELENDLVLIHRVKKSLENETLSMDKIFINEEKDNLPAYIKELTR